MSARPPKPATLTPPGCRPAGGRCRWGGCPGASEAVQDGRRRRISAAELAFYLRALAVRFTDGSLRYLWLRAPATNRRPLRAQPRGALGRAEDAFSIALGLAKPGRAVGRRAAASSAGAPGQGFPGNSSAQVALAIPRPGKGEQGQRAGAVGGAPGSPGPSAGLRGNSPTVVAAGGPGAPEPARLLAGSYEGCGALRLVALREQSQRFSSGRRRSPQQPGSSAAKRGCIGRSLPGQVGGVPPTHTPSKPWAPLASGWQPPSRLRDQARRLSGRKNQSGERRGWRPAKGPGASRQQGPRGSELLSSRLGAAQPRTRRALPAFSRPPPVGRGREGEAALYARRPRSGRPSPRAEGRTWPLQAWQACTAASFLEVRGGSVRFGRALGRPQRNSAALCISRTGPNPREALSGSGAWSVGFEGFVTSELGNS
ncbi:collagen alpha-1(I) chain-like [Candoia aspera]|uniref:collagen alpha-1(I) chain-like n=1 Tax=Candoia aspera TaxID=51853 RepID=UPI002FD870E8